MQIVWDLPNLFAPGSSPVDNAEGLKTLMEGLIALNMTFLRNNPRFPSIYDPGFGLSYGRTEVWDMIPGLYQRKYGDCKSLTAALIAERRVRDRRQAEPVFRFLMRPDGVGDYHILVWLGGNKWEDPSRALGMNAEDVEEFMKYGVQIAA